MIFKNVNIESFAYHLPDEVITSSQIEERLDPVYNRLKLPKGRLELMSGIIERRHWPIGTRPSDLSTKASENALEKSQIKRSEIDLLIHASVCRDFLEPSTASIVHHNLGLSDHCAIFDLSNACLGVLNSFVTAASMIDSGQIETCLIVSGENGGPLLEETIKFLNNDLTLTRKNIKKYVANLTIGSAATAYILTHERLAPEGHKILGGSIATDSTAAILCQGSGDTNSLMMETHSEELMQAGVKLAKSNWERFKKELNWNNDTAKWIVGHQVGVAHEKLMLDKLKLNKTLTYKTYPTLGNTGSAALPITLARLAESGDLRKNERLALLGIGSGLSTIMLGVEW